MEFNVYIYDEQVFFADSVAIQRGVLFKFEGWDRVQHPFGNIVKVVIPSPRMFAYPN